MTNLRRPFRLAVELLGSGQHPASWSQVNSEANGGPKPTWLAAATSLAQRGGIDFAIIADSFVPSETGNPTGAQLDAVLLSSFVSQRARQIGLVPQVSTTWVEPFHISKAVATLDHVSRGRGGWQPVLQHSQATAQLFGGQQPERTSAVVELAEVTDVTKKLWDSWEDDAVIKDVKTGRYLDRGKVHYVNYEAERFSVKGPSITPRPPQGHPVTVLNGDDPNFRAISTAAADVIRITPAGFAQARQFAAELKHEAAALGRTSNRPLIFADVSVLLSTRAASSTARANQYEATYGPWDPPGLYLQDDPQALSQFLIQLAQLTELDGVVLRPAAVPSDLGEIVHEVVPQLIAAGLRPQTHYSHPTLRGNLGLTRPANQFAAASPTTEFAGSLT